jgi:hypothetical protein
MAQLSDFIENKRDIIRVNSAVTGAISGSHGGEYEGWCLLSCCAM